MKKLLVTLLTTASLAASPIVFGATQVIEVKNQGQAQVRTDIRSAVDVVILRFDTPIEDLRNKIVEFEASQAKGISYSTKDAALFFNHTDQVSVEFNKGMADAAGNSGSLEAWHRSSVPVTSVVDNGKTKTTTHTSTVLQTGASAFVSVSGIDATGRAHVEMKIHQIVPTSATDVSPYFGSANAKLRGGEILPIFWTNNGTQYCAFLTFSTSKNKI